jgi:hypothetical protein
LGDFNVPLCPDYENIAKNAPSLSI